MKRNTRIVLSGMLVLLLIALTACGTQSSSDAKEPQNEAYPTKPITDICPWSAGGSSDIIQRLIGSYITKYLGQTLIVENQAGGAAVPGTAATADADPDGYTIGCNWGASWTLRPFVLDVPYTIDDFTFIVGFMRQENFLVVNADSPWETLDDLVNYGKEHPGELNCGGATAASYENLCIAAFMQQAGVESMYVPYDGSRDTVIALLAGNLDVVDCEITSCISEVESGAVRVLCVFSDERSETMPEVPTAKELGYDISFPHTACIVGPADMPADRVQILHDAFKAVLEDEEFLEVAKNAGYDIIYKSGEEVKREIEETIETIEPIASKIFK